MNYKKCLKCGTNNERNARFCRKCGEPFHDTNTNPRENELIKENEKTEKVAIISFVIIILV
ncbi:MAG TPA: hypothetical protein DD650_00580, partial [Ruminococcaceae bacterium]|nr:hypothetical protein [Oscillospiraceae bacterium]